MFRTICIMHFLHNSSVCVLPRYFFRCARIKLLYIDAYCITVLLHSVSLIKNISIYRPALISSLSLFCFTVSQKPSLSKSRPGSAGLLKETDSLSAQAQSNQLAIVSALRKLVDKQAARQYSTSSHISLLTQHVSHDLHVSPCGPTLY